MIGDSSGCHDEPHSQAYLGNRLVADPHVGSLVDEEGLAPHVPLTHKVWPRACEMVAGVAIQINFTVSWLPRNVMHWLPHSRQLVLIREPSRDMPHAAVEHLRMLVYVLIQHLEVS